ncbi:MAG TPA: hypothetical protein VGR11_05455 [Solirubrobacteraceae bacterium]|nr:hypothetical protein [Solirubrobacteraceae bacterium]
MSRGARIGVLVATVVVLGLAFVLLAPEADDGSNVARTPTTPPATTDDTPPATNTSAASPPPVAADHDRAFETIRVAGGEPSGGIKKITVQKGQRARIEVTTSDTSDEIHLHGYDITQDLEPGSAARFSFDADAEGIFEIELHGTHTQIGELTVEP